MSARRHAARSLPAALALLLLAPVAALLAYLPGRLSLWVGRRLGGLLWWLLPHRRRLAASTVARAFGPEIGPEERDRIARQSFEHLGMNLVEVCALLFRPPAALLARVELSGHEHVEKAAAEGKGILLLSAHLGNWELLGPSHLLTAFPLSIVVRPLDEPLLDRLADRFRRRSGVEPIAKRQGLRGVLDALRRGRMVGVLLDQNSARSEGVFAPFFGVPASTSRGLALIALRTGAPVVPVFIRPVGRGHRVEFDPAVPVPPSGDLLDYTVAFNRVIESAIRRTPEQWFWMHDRWRTRMPVPTP